MFEFVPEGLVVRPNKLHFEKLYALAKQVFKKKAPCGNDLVNEDTSEELEGDECGRYRSICGDRLDLSYVVRALSSKMSKPTQKMLKVAEGVIGYLRNTEGLGVLLKRSWPEGYLMNAMPPVFLNSQNMW